MNGDVINVRIGGRLYPTFIDENGTQRFRCNEVVDYLFHQRMNKADLDNTERGRELERGRVADYLDPRCHYCSGSGYTEDGCYRVPCMLCFPYGLVDLPTGWPEDATADYRDGGD